MTTLGKPITTWLLAITSLTASTGWGTAAEPPVTARAPAWGTIDTAAERVGRYVFDANNRPADGRLEVPAEFPQIVRATLRGEQPQDLAIDINSDATAVAVLLPSAAAGSDAVEVAIETADESRQFDDGRIVLAARDARVSGTQAKLESHPGNHRIGFWSNPADTVTWTRKLTRWGAYDVRLTFSTAAAAGTEVEVALGDARLTGRLSSTGSWYRYATLPLGRVVLPTAGDLEVTVRCTKLVGGAVMNLKAVTLEPACEGSPPVQADDGSITLHGRDATVFGTTLRYEPAEKKQTLGFWTKASDAAAWTFTVAQPGEFTVEVLQGCGTGQGGSEMVVDVDRGTQAATALSFVVEDTGGFQAFRPREIGRVRIATTGVHQLRVQPQKIARAAACDIRQIRLVPVSP